MLDDACCFLSSSCYFLLLFSCFILFLCLLGVHFTLPSHRIIHIHIHTHTHTHRVNRRRNCVLYPLLVLLCRCRCHRCRHPALVEELDLLLSFDLTNLALCEEHFMLAISFVLCKNKFVLFIDYSR